MPFGASRLSFLALSQTDGGSVAPASRSTITVNGDAQIDTSRSKFGGASLLLDGTDDWVTIEDTTFNSQTAFTWECFFNVDVDAGGGTVSLMSNRVGGYEPGDLMLLFRNYDMKLQLSSNGTGGMNLAPPSMSAISTDTWHHVAVARNSNGDWGLWFNGSRLGNGTGWTQTLDNDIGIGAHADGTLEANAGTDIWFDEVRVSSVDRYNPSSTSITVPTSAFTNDSDTLALLHMDGTDGSVNITDDETTASARTAKTVTANGDAQVSTTQSKFGGASLYSDGATDYLTVSADSDFVMGSNDFTLECWVRPASSGVGSGDQIISKWSGGNGYSYGLTYGTSSPKNNIRALINDTGGIRGVNMGSSPLTVDAWNHVALVVESGTLALYANGNRLGTTSVTAFNDATNTDITISALGGGSYSPNHYQDEVRISDIARYTGSTYTQPTGPFTNDANTLLLLHMDGTNASTDFTDDNGVDRSTVGVSAHGNAQIDTAQSKFGGASAYFDGNDDYLTIHGVDGSFNDEWVNGSEWTVEYWVRGTSFSGYEVHFGDWGGASDRSFFLGSDTGGDIMFFYTDSGGTLDTAIRADTVLSTNSWHHIALVKDSTNFTLYVDGSSVDSGASENIRAQGNPTRIGAAATNAEDFIGYIDEVRVSDTARYTANFTPESTQFTNDSNTLLLLHMDGSDASTTFTDDNS